MKSQDTVSVPIRRRSGVGSTNIAAIVGLSDIISYILEKGQSINLSKDCIESVESLGLGDEIEESYRIWERDFLDTIESTLTAFARGVHRALITDVLNQRKAYLLTQTDIIRFIHANPSVVSASIDLTIPIKISLLKQLGDPSSVITMRDNRTVIDGLALMKEKKIAAVPVVDKDGKIVANFSASDLRGITEAGLVELKKPVLEYLKSANGHIRNPILCTPQTSLSEVLELLVTNRIHQLWVVDSPENPIPTGVVTRSDIIGTLVGVEAR
ncbi:uncharacterized protein EV422DRAFT_493178 [Fimicolochytrium jonesii]|uniref:uncharacterized protein n=1 Tax=Fimicolochytrium jonesii TaxID=1396493 RepID=UPI0022FF25E6|nr:uncharacterized protein EV422DRAFT_493178 [Fimicolochytrium jonesii]KAI8824095.1 hypothetical protein EV422DRAFT_493178 [Fimicolochytrium jonesii]